jgi:hypothetical protein
MSYYSKPFSVFVAFIFLSMVTMPVRQQVVVIRANPGHTTSSPFLAEAVPIQPPQEQSRVIIEKITFPESRYRLLNHFARIFFCDPDMYPVGHDEKHWANLAFPEIMKDAPAFQVMAKRLGFEKTVNFSDDQKLSFYREYKELQFGVRLASEGEKLKFSLRYREDPLNYKHLPNNGFSVSGFVDPHGEISVSESVLTTLQCPVCLSAGTLIQTTNGEIAIEDLKPVMLAWTLDARGARVATPILNIISMPVPADHMMIQLRLSDGRELSVSPGHPTADTRFVDQLKSGASYSGALIRAATWQHYHSKFTYDLLVAGDTGFYWANGILLASSLR